MRPYRPRSFFALLGSVASASAALALMLLSPGCDEAKLTASPDDAGCADPVIGFPCVLGAVGGAGCTGDLGTSTIFGRDVVLDGSAPVSCRVFVNKLVPDQDNQCALAGSCTCEESDGGAFGWVCTE